MFAFFLKRKGLYILYIYINVFKAFYISFFFCPMFIVLVITGLFRMFIQGSSFAASACVYCNGSNSL